MTKEVINKNCEYLSNYVLITERLLKHMKEHSKEYKITGEVCAWYKNMEDFYSDWCRIGYTRKQVSELKKNNPMEFQTIRGVGILRYII